MGTSPLTTSWTEPFEEDIESDIIVDRSEKEYLSLLPIHPCNMNSCDLFFFRFRCSSTHFDSENKHFLSPKFLFSNISTINQKWSFSSHFLCIQTMQSYKPYAFASSNPHPFSDTCHLFAMCEIRAKIIIISMSIGFVFVLESTNK